MSNPKMAGGPSANQGYARFKHPKFIKENVLLFNAIVKICSQHLSYLNYNTGVLIKAINKTKISEILPKGRVNREDHRL